MFRGTLQTDIVILGLIININRDFADCEDTDKAVPDTQISEYRYYVFVMAKYRLVDHVRPRMASMKQEGRD